MYTIIIKGEACTDHGNLRELDDIDCQDCFSEYFDNRDSYANVVTGGFLHFEFKDDKLWSVTIYQSSRELSEEELTSLEDYTSGQWSDGIGEGFEQHPCFQDEDNEDVYISPWSPGQITTITQTKNG